MKFVNQTKLHDPDKGIKGNCLTACIATLLHLDIEDVPNFEDISDDTWFFEYKKWLYSKNMIPITFNNQDSISYYTIMSGPSPRNPKLWHSVIYYKGKIVHDPHPSKAGLVSTKEQTLFIDIGATKKESYLKSKS